jgi:hypothetical protein
LIIPWSFDHYVNILSTNETESQQLLDLSKKKKKIKAWLMLHEKYASNSVHRGARQTPVIMVHMDKTFARK